MSIFKFNWPYAGKLSKESEVKVAGQPIARVIDIEETPEGIVVTAEFYDPESKEAKLVLGIDPTFGLSLGPNPTMQDYAKADAELTMSMYQSNREGREQDAYDAAHGWIKPGTRMGCLTVILASIGLWILIYFFLHWAITGEAFPLFEW